jgi:hypothetical protein
MQCGDKELDLPLALMTRPLEHVTMIRVRQTRASKSRSDISASDVRSCFVMLPA